MRFCTNRITSEIQNLGTIAGQPANSISVAEDEKGNMQFFALGMANYMGGGDALLVFQQNNGELIPMHGSGDIRSLAEHKPMAARSPQGKDIYHLFTVGQGQVPYMHTADMSADGHSGGLKGSFTQTNRPLDNSGALYGQHISVAEDGSRGLRAYMSRHIPAAEMSQPGITELVVFNISPSGDVTGPQVLASIESNDRLGRGEITLSPDGRTLAYFNRNRYLGGFDYHTVEIYTIALDQSGLMAASEPSKVEGPAYGTGRKGSIEWQGSELYWNQYGLYSDIGQDQIFARVLKTGQTQPVSSGEYGDLRFSGDYVYKLGQAGTSLKTASATAAADDRPGYLPGQPWRASGTGPQLSYRRKGIRQYELTDHLGNVRAVIGDRLKTETAGTETAGTVTAYKPDLLSATDYFPFGMQMPGRVFSGSEYRYGFNGMEKDDAEGNTYTTEFRQLDVRIGRWWSLDPKVAQMPWQSSYCSMDNNPILYNDPLGDVVKVTTGAGNYLFSLNDGKTKVRTMTAIDVYNQGTQWFEPLADNYMPLLDKADNLSTNPGLLHFTWDQIATFAEEDRMMLSYTQEGSGDWKQSEEGANGFFLITVDGEPYWHDAIGQIPFAVDYFTDIYEDNNSKDASIRQTIVKGKEYGEGKIFGAETDNSNTYDNYFLLRGALWAANRYDTKSGTGFFGDDYDLVPKDTDASGLGAPIELDDATKYGVR